MEERLSSNREGRLFHTRKVHIYTKERVFLILDNKCSKKDIIVAYLVEKTYFCDNLYNRMRENKLMSSVRTTSFEKIVSYLASNKANIGGDICRD